jgi:hypothetical protein
MSIVDVFVLIFRLVVVLVKLDSFIKDSRHRWRGWEFKPRRRRLELTVNVVTVSYCRIVIDLV